MKKIQIGICDDELDDLAQICKFLQDYNDGEQLQVHTFQYAMELFNVAKQQPLDIALLDIEMPSPTGFDIAKELVKLSSPPVIVFVTRSKVYALKGYGIAIRYLQKPITNEAFCEAMDAAIGEVIAHRLTIQIDNALFALKLSEIQYIEIFGHYTIVHTNKESFRFRSTLKELIAQLPQSYFISPHKSYIVNLEHVHSASASEIIMDCGARVPIGRTRAHIFNESLFRFLGR